MSVDFAWAIWLVSIASSSITSLIAEADTRQRNTRLLERHRDSYGVPYRRPGNGEPPLPPPVLLKAHWGFRLIGVYAIASTLVLVGWAVLTLVTA